MGSFDYKKLSEILVRAQGQRTRQRYAFDAGISLTYLSNLVKGKTVGPPSPATLRKLAVASGGATTFDELMEACGHQAGSPDEELAIVEGEREAYLRTIDNALSRQPVEPDGDTLTGRTGDAVRRQLYIIMGPCSGRPTSYSSRSALMKFVEEIDDINLLRRVARFFDAMQSREPRNSIARLLQFAIDNGYTVEDLHVVANLVKEIRERDRVRGME